MSVLKLSNHVLMNELRCPAGKSRIEFCDKDLPGLYVEVRAGNPGQGTYYLRYKDVTGKTCHQKIGRTCDIDLAEARKKAKQLKAEVALGANPRGEAKAQKEVPNLAAFFDDTYLPYARQHKRSWKRDCELMAKLRPHFGHQRLHQVSRQRVQQLHVDLVDKEGLKPASADHVLKLIRRMYSLAIEWQVIAGPNPFSRMRMFRPDNRVDNHLDRDQFARLMAVLDAEQGNAVALVCRFLLATGCRLNEALSARWADINLEAKVWRIPATNSKSKRIRSVPLTPAALDCLQRADTAGKCEHAFVNRRKGKRYGTRLVAVAKTWDRIRTKAGLPNLRIHDLRHTFASQLANAGTSLYVIQQLLGHSSPTVTERYSHLQLKTLADAANVASDALQEAANSASLAIKRAEPVAG
jgi:integrase